MERRRETMALLADIERRIDPETEEAYQQSWRDFLYGRYPGEVFRPVRRTSSAPGIAVEHVNINDAIGDFDLMLRGQLEGVCAALSGNGVLNVRSNYGTGIMTSLFGAEIFPMAREHDTLPTTRSLDDTDAIEAILDKGMPDLRHGFGGQVFDFGELWQEATKDFPKVRKYVRMYHPDLQGPLDVAELLWGGEMFYSMYDEPELVHRMLRLITDTYTAFIEKWFSMYPPDPVMNCHWGTFFHRGALVIRDDSAMNLSPDFYREFAAPYDGELLGKYGGVVHFCGRGDHYMETLTSLPGLYGINMSQPEYNDMETIYRCTVDRGIPILAFSREWAEKDVSREGGFRHLLSV